MYIHTYIPTLNTYVKCSIFLREKLKCVVFGIVVTLCGKVLGQVECCELFLDITWYSCYDICTFKYIVITSMKPQDMHCYIGML